MTMTAEVAVNHQPEPTEARLSQSQGCPSYEVFRASNQREQVCRELGHAASELSPVLHQQLTKELDDVLAERTKLRRQAAQFTAGLERSFVLGQE